MIRGIHFQSREREITNGYQFHANGNDLSMYNQIEELSTSHNCILPYWVILHGVTFYASRRPHTIPHIRPHITIMKGLNPSVIRTPCILLLDQRSGRFTGPGKFPFRNVSIPRRANKDWVLRVPTAIPYRRAMVLQSRHLSTAHLHDIITTQMKTALSKDHANLDQDLATLYFGNGF